MGSGTSQTQAGYAGASLGRSGRRGRRITTLDRSGWSKSSVTSTGPSAASASARRRRPRAPPSPAALERVAQPEQPGGDDRPDRGAPELVDRPGRRGLVALARRQRLVDQRVGLGEVVARFMVARCGSVARSTSSTPATLRPRHSSSSSGARELFADRVE